MSKIVIRIRTQIGTWRLSDVSLSDTVDRLRQRLSAEHKVDMEDRNFFFDAKCTDPLPCGATVSELRLQNGHMLYTTVDAEKTGIHEASATGKKITKEGNIVAQDIESVFNSKGFRPGMQPLSSMKKHWTLGEYVALDEQFEYNLKAEKEFHFEIVSVDKSAINSFQMYVRNFDFRIMRVGYLYGRVLEDKTVKVECIYEPPQDTTDTSFTLLSDPKADAVEAIADMLGMKKVGWIFAHPPREKGFFFSGPEVLFTAEQQLEFAQGIEESTFATIRVTVGEDGLSEVEAYQVTKQCMELTAEGVIGVSANLGNVSVNPTFTCLVERRSVKEIPINYFLILGKIEQFESDFLVNFFPPANRIDSMQTRDDIKAQLNKVGQKGWTLNGVLADFHLLVYLTEFLGLQDDIPGICRCAVEKDMPLEEGNMFLLRSIAGLD